MKHEVWAVSQETVQVSKTASVEGSAKHSVNYVIMKLLLPLRGRGVQLLVIYTVLMEFVTCIVVCLVIQSQSPLTLRVHYRIGCVTS